MHTRSSKYTQKGVAIVEFALILPLLLILTFITTEFGRALYEYQSVAKSVRVAARYLSMQNAETHREEAENLVIYGYTQPPSGASPLARGLTGDTVDINITWGPSQGTAPVIVPVTVVVRGYQFQSIFTTAFGLTFGTVPFSDITATMRSHV